MSTELAFDESLVRRLPLPLAQVYRCAHNAENPFQQHLAAFAIWELGLKLLASTAIVEYVEQGLPDPTIDKKLKNLVQPQLGQWREIARLLVSLLAQRGDQAFAQVRDFLSDKTRDDMPRAAGLQAAVSKMLKGKAGAHSTVQLSQLFDDLVQYRNKVALGHGAPSQLESRQHQQMAAALLAGLTEILRRLDVMAGRRLLYVADVRQESGFWLVNRFELVGETAARLDALKLPRDVPSQLPDGRCVYLQLPGSTHNGFGLQSLHPLMVYELESKQALILNGRKGRPPKRTEYLCYTTGLTSERTDEGPEPRRLLALALDIAVDAAGPATGSPDPSATDEEPPQSGARSVRHIGEFQLLSELGEGGMGVVYRAWQPSLRRQVALKVISRPGIKAEARFSREIHALGKVDNPHVVKAITSGSDGADWYYAMELVEGVPLSAVCERLRKQTTSVTQVNLDTWNSTLSTACADARDREKPLSDSQPALAPKPTREPSGPSPPSLGPGRDYPRRIVELMVQVAEACQALHEAGVVHRDIKPANIMVKADGKQAVLVDLGVAQLADDVDGKLTRTRELVGTLRYASPQQVLAAANLDHRTDLYSLGVTLWEMLTLRPFLGADDELPIPILMEKIQRDEPAPIRSYHPGIARDLEAVVQKCLEKDPRRRYQTAAEVGADLQRFLNGEPVLARSNRWRTARRRFAQRTARLRGFLPPALVLGAVACSVWAVYFRPTMPPRLSTEGAPSPAGVAANKAQQPAGESKEATVKLAVVAASRDDMGQADKSLTRNRETFTPAETKQFEELMRNRFPEERQQFLAVLEPMSQASRALIFKNMHKAIEIARHENAGAVPEPPPPEKKGACYALLVACTKFDNRPKLTSLQGPANDVQLMRQVLESSYGFLPDKIVVLSEQTGTANRPTRHNIEREFLVLASQVKQGDQVAILLSGHGSQAPGPDGALHSIFLPADIGATDATGQIANSIDDANLRLWLSAITSKGAKVFLVMDAAHSGTAAATEADGLVTAYSSRADEYEVERPMPYGDPHAKRHGLLTFALCEILAKATHGGSSLTYRELGERLQAQYVDWGRLSGPTPYVAGATSDLDREVFGTAVHQGRSRIVLAYSTLQEAWVINVGRLHGVSTGSVLSVYPLVGEPDADKPLCYARVTDCRIVDSIVQPVAYGGLPAPKELPRHGRCVLVNLDFGDFRVAILIDKTGVNGAPPSNEQRNRLDKLESNLDERAKQTSSLFRMTASPAEARWIIQYRGRELCLLPADAAQIPLKGPLPKGTPVFQLPDEQADATIESRLQIVSRAQNLLAVAVESRAASSAFDANGRSKSEGDPDTPRLRLELLRCRYQHDKAGTVVPLAAKEPTLGAGDFVAFRTTNEGRSSVEFTLLFIDSQFGITPVWPLGGVDNRLMPGQTFQTPAFRISDSTVGREHVVAIAIRSEPGLPPVDFTFLAQDNATDARHSLENHAGPNVARSYDSPLGKLLRKAAFADGTTRTFGDADARNFDLRTISWIVGKGE